jgi:ribosomal protein S18 acetylase RimI-like enzyme
MRFHAPIATVELGRRLTRVGLAYTMARMRVIEAHPGNPFGVEFKEIDGVTGLMSRVVPSPHFNSVIGLRGGQESLVATFDDWYRENDVKPRFVTAPGEFTRPQALALARALTARRYAQTGFDTVLYAAPMEALAIPAGIELVEVTSHEMMEQFLDAYLAGWDIPQEFREGSRTNMRAWLGKPDWRLFLARIDGRAGAAGKLFIHDRVGFFCDAATDPNFRGRGLQTALLRHRAAAARTARVELIFSHADFGSTSHHNMERLGLRVLYTRAVWTRLDPQKD